MNGLTIKCYGDRDECQHYVDGWCNNFDRPCEEVHIDMFKEDGEG